MSGGEARRVVAELVGTAVLLAAVVGSGIVVQGEGTAASQLFQHAVVVGTALAVLIVVLGPISGAHFNPAVTLADWWFGGISRTRALRYVPAQLAGALIGTAATNAMFGEAALAVSDNARDGLGLAGGEAVATAGLVLVIFALARSDRAAAVPAAVGAWIGAAIVFTSSASFANPAVTLARVVTDTWTGIAPSSVPGFLLGQAAGVVAGVALTAWLFHPTPADASDVVVPSTQMSSAHPSPHPGGPS